VAESGVENKKRKRKEKKKGKDKKRLGPETLKKRKIVIVWKRFGKGLGKVWERFGKGLEKVWEKRRCGGGEKNTGNEVSENLTLLACHV
jgi:hypothetical protein